MATYCFGDSFIGMFTLVKNFRVFKFKGGTAKGLARKDSETRQKISSVIEALSKKTRETSCFLFQFGSVDVHHSYFYKLFRDSSFDPLDIEGFVNPIVDNYVNFIDSLDCVNKFILAPHYSPVKTPYVLRSLIRYGAITTAEQPNAQNYISRIWRNKLIATFCDRLEQQIEGKNISLIDLRSTISKNGIVSPKYIDISEFNIHLSWEPLLMAYLPFLGRCGMTMEDIDFSQRDAYLMDKEASLRYFSQQATRL